MRIFIFAFLCGISSLYFFHQLPKIDWFYFAFLISILFLYFYYSKKISFIIIVAGVLFGFSYAGWRAENIFAFTLPHRLEGKTIPVTGYVASIPKVDQYKINFDYVVTHFNQKKNSFRIRLSVPFSRKNNEIWHFHAGEVWHFYVRLKRVHGVFNPGGNDTEASAFRQGIRAQGYVVTRLPMKYIKKPLYLVPLTQWREKIKDKLAELIAPSATSVWLTALAIGERSAVPATYWGILRATGTNHLMAIAGLHIGFIAGLFYFLANRIWRFSARLCLFVPAQTVAQIAALFGAVIYASLAGFSLPAQRTVVMLSVFYLSVLFRRKIPLFQGYCLALFFVLILQPFSILDESFWLSFGAVGLIIVSMSGRKTRGGYFFLIGKMQWVMTLGLLPLTAWFFQQYSCVSLFANLLAVPWMGFIILPCIFFAMIFLSWLPIVSAKLFLFADKNLTWLWQFLTAISHWQFATLSISITSWLILFLAMTGVFLLLLPAGFPKKWLGFFLVLPLFFSKIDYPATGNVWFTLLDVGQGLSAVVETAQHVLVFDAGPAMGVSDDMGERVVLPFLQSRQIKIIDNLVISHGDNDHIGGARTLLKNFLVKKIQTSVPEKFTGYPVFFCLAGESWQWDGVLFEFLYPEEKLLHQGNDSSCVLRVTAQNKTILLTGDIEKKAEKILLAKNRLNKTTILVAPHHGSKTSALKKFVARVHPKYVLFPLGYRNRYHFPHPSVVRSWQQEGSLLFATAQTGAIFFDVSPSGKMPHLFRQEHVHFWQDTGEIYF